MQSIEQNKRFLGLRTFEFIDDNTIKIKHKNWRHQLIYMIDVVALSEKCHHRFLYSKRALTTFIVLFVLSIITYFSPLVELIDLSIWYSLMTSVFFAFTVVMLIALLSSIRHERIFRLQNSKIPVIWLFSGEPNARACKTFIDYIKQRIRYRREFLNLTPQQYSAGELKTLRRLVEDKIIPTKEYERAKKKLLKLSDKH